MPIPLRGRLSAPFRLFGVRPSRMNPNTCTICKMAFSKIMNARAQAIAKSGEILVTSAVRDRNRDMITAAGSDHALKGFDQPVTLFPA
ncbi:hypothetical protein [Bradyrhizobium sp. USDA 3364]